MGGEDTAGGEHDASPPSTASLFVGALPKAKGRRGRGIGFCVAPPPRTLLCEQEGPVSLAPLSEDNPHPPPATCFFLEICVALVFAPRGCCSHREPPYTEHSMNRWDVNDGAAHDGAPRASAAPSGVNDALPRIQQQTESDVLQVFCHAFLAFCHPSRHHAVKNVSVTCHPSSRDGSLGADDST